MIPPPETGSRLSGSPPGVSLNRLVAGTSATRRHSSPSAVAVVSVVSSRFLPLCCSSRPTKKLQATMPPMTTRAKMARARAMPRSFRINRSVDAISQENPGAQLLDDRNAGCRVLGAADAFQCQLDTSDRAGNGGGEAEGIGIVEPKAVLGQG